jgi:hypothetical protein
VFSLSAESQKLVQRFTVILKDVVNGAPTAYDDLVALLDDSSDTLQKNYKHLPSYLQKLIKTLPAKFSGNLGPEILATAAAAAGGADGGTTSAGKSRLRIPSLKEIVTKPGAVVGLLRAIMNFLKLRWPAFLGTNVLLSLGLFGTFSSSQLYIWQPLTGDTVLLFVLWYCHKRGRETRLAKEKFDSDGKPIADGDRFEELSSDDDGYEIEGESSRQGPHRADASSSSAGPSSATEALRRHVK